MIEYSLPASVQDALIALRSALDACGDDDAPWAGTFAGISFENLEAIENEDKALREILEIVAKPVPKAPQAPHVEGCHFDSLGWTIEYIIN